MRPCGTDDFGAALRGLAAFAATRLAAASFATFADFLDVLPAIVFTPTDRLICQITPAEPRPTRKGDTGDTEGAGPVFHDVVMVAFDYRCSSTAYSATGGGVLILPC